MTNTKDFNKTAIFLIIALLFTFFLSFGTVEAALGGVSGGGFEGTDAFEHNSNVVGGMMDDIGIDEESAQRGKQAFSPIAKVLNDVIAILTLIIAFGLIIMSLLDMVYMILPPLRPLLYNPSRTMNFVTHYPVAFVAQYEGSVEQQQGGAGSPMGGGMGGMGRPPMGGMSGMGGMGGMSPPMGGMGSPMGGMGGQQQQADKPKIKGVLLPYLKYRTIELIIAGVCLGIFTGTMLTDVGLWIVSFIPGV